MSIVERKFNIRVYGIFIEAGKVLLTDEYRLGTKMTKFPGGGLKYGEGTIDCLKRECREELNSEIEVLEHFYTTDYFQPSILLPEPQQIINIYYRIHIPRPFGFKISDKKFDFEKLVDGDQSFRMPALEKLKADELTLPIDKKVIEIVFSQIQTPSSS